MFFHSGCTIYILIMVHDYSLSPHPCQHLLSLIFLIIIFSKLSDNISLGLICIFQMVSNIEGGFMYPFYYCSLFGKCLISPLPIFWSDCLLYDWCIVLSPLDISNPYKIYSLQCFLPFHRLPFHFDNDFCCCAATFTLM